MTWFVIHTRYGDEQRTAQNVERLGREVFVPTIEVDRRKQKKANKRVAMFPCYAFVWLEIGKHDFSEVRRTPGVYSILSYNRDIDGCMYPTPAPTDFVEKLREYEGKIQPKNDYQSGDRVRDVVPGSAAYLYEAVVKQKTADGRLKILYDTLHGKPIERIVEYAEVEPA